MANECYDNVNKVGERKKKKEKRREVSYCKDIESQNLFHKILVINLNLLINHYHTARGITKTCLLHFVSNTTNHNDSLPRQKAKFVARVMERNLDPKY